MRLILPTLETFQLEFAEDYLKFQYASYKFISVMMQTLQFILKIKVTYLALGTPGALSIYDASTNVN